MIVQKDRMAKFEEVIKKRTEYKELLTLSYDKRKLVCDFMSKNLQKYSTTMYYEQTEALTAIETRIKDEETRESNADIEFTTLVSKITNFSEKTTLLYHAARVACSIFFLYQTDETETFITPDVYCLLTYGSGIFRNGEDHEHNELYLSGGSSISKWWTTFKSKLPAFISSVLKKRVKHLYEFGEKHIDTANMKLYHGGCLKFIQSIKYEMTDVQFINSFNLLCMTYPKYDIRWRMLSVDARKGICKTQVKYVPVTYPKLVPKLEWSYGVTCMINLLIEYYHEDNYTPYAGMCFEIPLTKTVLTFDWGKGTKGDATKMKDVDLVELVKQDVEEFPQMIPHDKKDCQKVDPDTKKEYMTYSNPTKDITDRYFNTKAATGGWITDILPNISARVSTNFTKNILPAIWASMFPGSDSIMASPNVAAMSALDYLYCEPDVIGDMAPLEVKLAVDHAIILNSFGFNLIFPLPAAVTANFVNTELKNSYAFWDTELPQNAFHIESVDDDMNLDKTVHTYAENYMKRKTVPITELDTSGASPSYKLVNVSKVNAQ